MNRPIRGKVFERSREISGAALTGWTPAGMNLGVAEFAKFQAVNTTPELWRVRLPRRPAVVHTIWPARSGRPPLPLIPSPPNPSPAAWRGVQEKLLVQRRPAKPAEPFVNVAPIRDVVAPKGGVVAPKYRFCATLGIGREFCVSHSCVRRSIDFRTIASDRKNWPNHANAATQVPVWIGEAASSGRSR
jgi:hypothetical protein